MIWKCQLNVMLSLFGLLILPVVQLPMGFSTNHVMRHSPNSVHLPPLTSGGSDVKISKEQTRNPRKGFRRRRPSVSNALAGGIDRNPVIRGKRKQKKHTVVTRIRARQTQRNNDTELPAAPAEVRESHPNENTADLCAVCAELGNISALTPVLYRS